MTDNNWSSEVEELLEKLRINCVNLSEHHRKRYYHYKDYSKYFRIPILILSSLNATTSVGLQPFMPQKWISLTNCGLGMIIGIITGIEMFLNITANMDLELTQSKEFYTMSVDIYKTLHLPPSARGQDGTIYLNKKYSHYTKLKESSILLNKRLTIDTIAHVPEKLRIGSDGTHTPKVEEKEVEDSPSISSIDSLIGLQKSISEKYLNFNSPKYNKSKEFEEEEKEPKDLELQILQDVSI